MFKVNDKVFSKRNGKGVVKKVDKFSNSMTYLIRFKDHTLTWLPKENQLKLLKE